MLEPLISSRFSVDRTGPLIDLSIRRETFKKEGSEPVVDAQLIFGGRGTR